MYAEYLLNARSWHGGAPSRRRAARGPAEDGVPRGRGPEQRPLRLRAVRPRRAGAGGRGGHCPFPTHHVRVWVLRGHECRVDSPGPSARRQQLAHVCARFTAGRRRLHSIPCVEPAVQTRRLGDAARDDRVRALRVPVCCPSLVPLEAGARCGLAPAAPARAGADAAPSHLHFVAACCAAPTGARGRPSNVS